MLNYTRLGRAFILHAENIYFYVITLNCYDCRVLSLTGYSRISIPTKEYDYLGPHFGSKNGIAKGMGGSIGCEFKMVNTEMGVSRG